MNPGERLGVANAFGQTLRGLLSERGMTYKTLEIRAGINPPHWAGSVRAHGYRICTPCSRWRMLWTSHRMR